MPYCSRCGVEVDTHISHCPLCKSPIQQLDKNNKPITYYPKDMALESVNKKRYHKGTIIFLITIFCFIPGAISITADFMVNKGITWSVIPVFSLLSAWGLIFIIITLYKHSISLAFALFANLSLFLFSLAQVVPSSEKWFLPVGLSITTVVFFSIFCMILYTTYSKKKGFNIIAASLIFTTVIILFIDIFVSRFISENNKVDLSWSFFAIFSCTPIALFFLYLHYIKKVPFKFKRIFHL